MDGAAEQISAFWRLWAGLRALDEPPTAEAVQQLLGLATPLESFMVAAIEIDAGRKRDDAKMVRQGILRFRSALDDEQLAILNSFSDIAILGSPDRRRELLREFWFKRLGQNDPIVKLLNTHAAADAVTLLEYPERTAISQLPEGLQQELQREVAWLAIDTHIRHRDPVWPKLLGSPLLELSLDTAGYWEFELIRSIRELLRGAVDDAIGRLGRLAQHHGNSPWRLDAIRRAVTVYSPLAAPRVKEWSDAIPGPQFLMAEATTPSEELGAALVSGAGGLWPDGSLELVHQHLTSRPAAAFLCLIQFAEQGIGEGFANLLLPLAKDPVLFSALPWPGRVDLFAQACLKLPVDTGFRLLAAAATSVASPQLQRALIDRLETASAQALDQVDRTWLLRQLESNAGELSESTRMIFRRGGVYRAIIDGANLVLAGVHGRDRQGSFGYYEQAVEELRQAGFREIITYFDASLRYGFDEWSEVEKLEALRQATIVRGEADPKVIASFMRHPHSAWIVTGDDYVKHIPEFPGFEKFWFKHRLHFHVNHHDRLEWGRPLDQADLPIGVPRQPRARGGVK